MSVERIRREMGLLERIASYIPGYRGYKEKEMRREADILVRRRVSMALMESRSILNRPLTPSAARTLANDQDIRFTFENLRAELDRATQRIDRAVSGYAGLFDAVKVREDRLDEVLNHDLKLIEKAESVKALVSDLVAMDTGSEGWRAKLNEVRAAVAELDHLIDVRAGILKGLVEVTG